MKWLFAVLVALNLMVFGGTIAYRMSQQAQEGGVALEGGRHELAQPDSLLPQAASEPTDAPAWVNAPEGSKEAREPESEEAIAERQKKEREAKLAKEKKEREEKAKREKEAREKALAEGNPAAAPNTPSAARQCTASATVVIDEDDYHRIKGLLGRWPHAASRTVEKREARANSGNNKTFRVLIPTDGDAVGQLENLAAKGFNGSIYDGQISVTVTRSRSAAQIQISRLSAAGFGGGHIVEQEDKTTSADSSLSVARMNITFMAVEENDAAELRQLVGRYGNLNLRACK